MKKSDDFDTLIGKVRKIANDDGQRRVALDYGGLMSSLDRIQAAHEREIADCKKPKRNCDLYETEDEAKEAYEELFYGTFQLKNCKDTIVALKPGSPEFSTWLMTPIKPNEQKRLSDKKEAKLSEMKSVMDVVRAMTGVPPKPFYYNSEVRELGHRIEELYTKEISNLKKKGA